MEVLLKVDRERMGKVEAWRIFWGREEAVQELRALEGLGVERDVLWAQYWDKGQIREVGGIDVLEAKGG